MVGLSVVLEAQKCDLSPHPQVINKTTIMLHKPSSSPSSPSHHRLPNFQAPNFLDQCFLCKKRLLPGKDIYMYKGDTGFCSVECRCKQIFMDEEESTHKEICPLAAIKRPTSPSSSPSSSSKPPCHHRKGSKDRAGGFAY